VVQLGIQREREHRIDSREVGSVVRQMELSVVEGFDTGPPHQPEKFSSR
jgi:hypothetical protein